MAYRYSKTAALAASVALLFTVAGAPLAHADPGGSDKSAAEALFDDAMRKLESKDYPAACKALEASQRLDPGIGTLLYLADCYEKSRRPASAWATFREAASTATAAGQTERAAVATRRAAALEGKLIRLVVSVPPASDLAGLEISRDGIALPKAVWNTALPIDPGEHALEVSAPGKKPWTKKITADESSASLTVEIPVLDVAQVAVVPPAAGPGAIPGGAPAKSGDAPIVDSSKHGGWNTQTTIGLVVGAVGLVGIGVGAGFGFDARSLNQQASDNCRPSDPTKCNSTGVSAGSQAHSAATASTIGFIAGGALLAGGVVIMLTSTGASKAKSGWIVEGGPTVIARAPGLLFGRTW